MTKLIEELREQKRALIRALELSNDVIAMSFFWANDFEKPISEGTIVTNKELIEEMEEHEND